MVFNKEAMSDIEPNIKHRYEASIRRLRREGRTRSEDHIIDWCAKPLSAKTLIQQDLILPNVVKIVRPCEENTEYKTYVLNAKYTLEVFLARSVHGQDRFTLPMDYKGRFQVLHDTQRSYNIVDVARIRPKCVKVKSIIKNISTNANKYQFPVDTIINIEGISYFASNSGVQEVLRCSFRGNRFFTLNMDCIGEFQILADESSYSLREIESLFPTPIRVHINETSTNHVELFKKSNTGEFFLETTSKEDFLVGNCKADNKIILFSSRSNVEFKVTNAVFQRERDNRFIVKHYGREYFPVKLDFAKILGLNGDSFVETKMEFGEEKNASLLNLI